MDIYLNQYKEVLDYLVSQRWEGMEYVTFQIGSGPVPKESLCTFMNHYEAQEYCFENSIDHDLYACLPIRSVYRCMSEALDDKSLLIEKDGVVDISAMVNLHYERMAVQTTTIYPDLDSEQKEVMINKKTTEFFEKDIEAKLTEGSKNKLPEKLGKQERITESPSTDREAEGLQQPLKKIPFGKLSKISPDKLKHQMKRRK